jgi:tripartite-type tricarboxylate transporter receptor subunit TctC
MKGKTFCLLVAILFGLTSISYAQVKDYPKKPIQMIIGHAAGSSVDLFYRLLADEVSKTWNVPVSAINKTGASGAVAANEVANSEKDGCTLLAMLSGQLTTFSIANPKSPVHVLRDFDPIEMHTYAPIIMFVRADSQFNSLDDIIDYARKKPGELICGVNQMGSTSHLETLLLNRLAKIDITFVHQEGPPQLMTGVLGGHYNLGWGNYAFTKPFITAGKIKPLVSDAKCPWKIPTFEEKGYPIALINYMSLVGPKGTPTTIIKAWEDALHKAMNDPKFQASLDKAAFVVEMITGTEKLNKLLKEEVARYSQFTPEELGWKQK